MEMGDIIKQLRLQKGLTQEELGAIIGVQKSAIRKYESGAVENMKRASIKKMADFFNVSPAYLMGLENFTNSGIIGNNNINNQIVNGVTLTPMLNAIVTVCNNLSEEKQGQILTYATKLLSEK